MLSISLKTLNIILMCLSEKKHLKKIQEKVQQGNNKKCHNYLKLSLNVPIPDKVKKLS